jgi:hypothetical protein
MQTGTRDSGASGGLLRRGAGRPGELGWLSRGGTINDRYHILFALLLGRFGKRQALGAFLHLNVAAVEWTRS